jgi:hypothetical protein
MFRICFHDLKGIKYDLPTLGDEEIESIHRWIVSAVLFTSRNLSLYIIGPPIVLFSARRT